MGNSLMIQWLGAFTAVGLGSIPGRGTSLVDQLVKNLPAMQKTWARSLGWEDPMEKGTATHSSTLAWRILAWVAKSWTQHTDFHFGASLVAQTVKNLPAIWKTWV